MVYAGFEQIYETGRIQEASLLGSRAQRVLRSTGGHKSPVAVEAIERIAGLYAIESEIRGRSPEERREIRNLRSRPFAELAETMAGRTLGKLSRKSDTALAVRYALGRWEALLRYCDNGRLEIDNNAAERALRVCRARKKKLSFRRLGWWWRKAQQPCTA